MTRSTTIIFVPIWSLLPVTEGRLPRRIYTKSSSWDRNSSQGFRVAVWDYPGPILVGSSADRLGHLHLSLKAYTL